MCFEHACITVCMEVRRQLVRIVSGPTLWSQGLIQFIRLDDMQLPTELSYELQSEVSNLMFNMSLCLKGSDWELFSI